MKVNWNQVAIMALVATAVVYASNHDLPVLGDRFRKLMKGGTGLI